MKRHAFTMQLKPGCAEEYKRRHDEIWPEIVQLLKHDGTSNYAIFLHEQTNTLFAVQELHGTEVGQHLKQGIYFIKIASAEDNGRFKLIKK